MPVEWAIALLPDAANTGLQKLASAALTTASSTALKTMDTETPAEDAQTTAHKVAAAVSGALGGYFGAAGAIVEFPLTTVIIMRAVAGIARSEGFDLNDPDIKAECVMVFGMGSTAPGKDKGAENAYYTTRSWMNGVASKTAEAFGKKIAEAAARKASEAAGKTAVNEAAKSAAKAAERHISDWLADIIEQVAERFGIALTCKSATRLVPILSAATAGTVTAMFCDHYQDMARGHFIMRRLERRYEPAHLQAAFKKLAEKPRVAYA